MATSFKISEKEGRIVHLQSLHHMVGIYLPYGAKTVKISPADPEILWLRANKSGGTTQNWLPWQRPLRNRKNWT